MLHKFLTPKPRNNTHALGGTNVSDAASAGGQNGANGGRAPLNISDIRRSIERYNEAQQVLNEELFGPVQNDSLVIVVQVRHCLLPLCHSLYPQGKGRQSSILDVHAHRCSTVWSVMFANFNVIISTICEWFQQTGMRPPGWWVGFPHSPAIAQTTVSSVRLCLALSEVECVCALWNKTPLQWFIVFYASKNCILLKTNLMFVCFLMLCDIFISGISQVVGTK